MLEDPVVARMQALIHRWETAANPQAVFLSCYRMMTSNMLAAIEQGEFQDSVWVDVLLRHFADYYFVSAEQRTARYSDYCHVNAIIDETIDEVQDQVLEPAMPAMDLVDRLLGPLDELLISRLINQWRVNAWQHACRLLEASAEDERTVLLGQVEEHALDLGKLLCRGAHKSGPQ